MKGNPNSRGILNNHTNIALLLQKATHKYPKLTVYWTKCLSLPCSLFTTACASLAFLAAEFFQFFKRHKWSFMKYIVSLFLFENGLKSWEILRKYSTIFRTSHQRCSIKKAILKHFVIFTGKHLSRGLFFNKVSDHQACNFIKKKLQHRYFLANIEKFIRRPTLKNSTIQLHCWKLLCENLFQIRSELSKRNYWWLAVWKVLKLVKVE